MHTVIFLLGSLSGLLPHPLIWVGSLVFLAISRRESYITRLALVCLFLIGFSLGWFRHWSHQQALVKALRQAPNQADHEPALVVGGVDRRETKSFVAVRLFKSRAKIRVTTSAYTKVQPGDIISLTCSLEWPEKPPPGGFDYATWLQRYGFARTCRSPFLARLPNTAGRVSWGLSWLRQSEQMREGLINRIYRLTPDPEASFLAGLLVGARATMPPDTAVALQRTGTTHVIAVSGANVMIIAGTLLWVARLITGRGPPAIFFTILGIWSFVVLTGTSAAAVRGGIVSTASLLITAAGRRPPPLTLVLSAAFITLMANPLIWQDIGWQLSLAAFSGLLVYDQWLNQKIKIKLPELLRQPLTQTIAASLPTLPLTMWHFATFTATSFLANPLVLWLIPVSTWVGLGSLVAAELLPGLHPVWRLVSWLPLHLALLIIETLAHLPWQLSL